MDFGSSDAAIDGFDRAAQLYQIPLRILRESSKELSNFYDADLVLVRPDQFVAWTSRDDTREPVEILRKAVGASL